jgi:hypothetical protein
MSGDHVEARRDAYVADGDIRIRQAAEPPPPRSIWGSVPAATPGSSPRSPRS